SHKMISTSIPEIPSPVSLAVIVVILAVSVTLSMRRPPQNQDTEDASGTDTDK
ncbi:TerC family protein, partial [Streptomyces sp. SID7982]|nr:TerC family protein [Streptomyces sp. SID7982]